MDLDGHEVYGILQGHGVRHLCHANTVATSCSFLREGRLMARGVAAARGLPQTRQGSDAADKELGLWQALFLDTCDAHQAGSARNKYGPVLFRFSLELLLRPGVGGVRVTRKNPLFWSSGDRPEDRYFASVEELRAEPNLVAPFSKMVLLADAGGAVELLPTLLAVTLDDPRRDRPGDGGPASWYGSASASLREASRVGRCPEAARLVCKRVCRSGCGCLTEYREFDEAGLRHNFAPLGHP
jgi:hypothetical protein